MSHLVCFTGGILVGASLALIGLYVVTDRMIP
jgi:hypothetical protein